MPPEPAHDCAMVAKHPIHHDQPDRRAAPDSEGLLSPSFKRDLIMSDLPRLIPFETDASEALLTMLQKAAQCSDMLPEERVEIATLKFLVLRARLRSERNETTVTTHAVPAPLPMCMRSAAPAIAPSAEPSQKRVHSCQSVR
jgi:hypothetical protein